MGNIKSNSEFEIAELGRQNPKYLPVTDNSLHINSAVFLKFTISVQATHSIDGVDVVYMRLVFGM